MNTKHYITIVVTALLIFIWQPKAETKWRPFGLEDQEVTRLIFDYYFSTSSNLIAGTNDGLYINDRTMLNNWKKDTTIRLSVSALVLNTRKEILAVAGIGSKSDAIFQGKRRLKAAPYYIFNRVQYLLIPQSLATKGSLIDTVFVGCGNQMYYSISNPDSTYPPFKPIRIPQNSFGVKKPKCAALDFFYDNQILFAGGYDQDTESSGQGSILWGSQLDTLQVIKQLNVSALHAGNHDIYIGTLDSGIYYHNVASSRPPIKLCNSPHNEPVHDLWCLLDTDNKNDLIFVAVKSGVFFRAVKNDSTWKELGDIPTIPNCITFFEKSNSDRVLYAGTANGVYLFDTLISPIEMHEQKIFTQSKPVIAYTTNSGNITLEFTLLKSGFVSFEVFNVKGITLMKPIHGNFTAGKQYFTLQNKAFQKNKYTNGMYIIKFSVGKTYNYYKYILSY